MLSTILSIPTLYIEDIYAAIGQSPEIAEYGAKYVHSVMPFVVIHYIGQCYASFAKYQRVTHYEMIATVVSTFAHATSLYVFYF